MYILCIRTFHERSFSVNIPTDPAILLSYVNTKLRDDFPTLEELCKSLCIPQDKLESKLASIGYSYDSSKNQFK